ncbi:MAG: hypothetical protein SFW07_03805 [Gammaproteobacteria bacterium]|nr:hypothetical protein [Gammaproteobacteria bacterium]
MSGENKESVELHELESGYQARPAQVFTPPRERKVRMSQEGDEQKIRGEDTVVDFESSAQAVDAEAEQGETRSLLAGHIPLGTSTEQSGETVALYSSVNASRCPTGSDIYRKFVTLVAQDLHKQLPAKTPERLKHFTQGSVFVLNKLWAPAFWGMLTWDVLAGAAAANRLYHISLGNILIGMSNDPITVTSNLGSDVAGEALYYCPVLLGVALPIVLGGGVWGSDFLRSKLEPEFEALEKRMPGIYQTYLKWKAGESRVTWKDIPFWTVVLGVLYADVRLLELFILKFKGFVAFLIAKTNCENQNKVWAYLNDWGNFECIVTSAAYLPDYRKFTSQLALDGLLGESRDPQFILDNIDELLKHPFGRLDLSRQNWRNWPRPQLRALLTKVSANIKSLHGFNISSSVQYSSFPNDGRLDDVVEFLRNVTTVSFSGINQGIGQTGFEQIWNATVQELKAIEMGGNNIQSVPTFLNETGLTRVSFPHTSLGDAGVTGLENSKVEEIDISDVGMTGQGIASVAQALPKAKVKKLIAANNNFQETDMKLVAEGFAESNLEEADFSGTQLVDEQVDDLTSVQSKTMQKWKLRNNGMTNVGLFSVVKNCRNTTVTDIDVFGNAIDDDGVSSSIGFLPETALENLGLGNTAITAESIKLLGQSGNLKSIDASYNPIGPDVVNVLMQNKTFLERLDLTSTGLDTASGVKLVGVLPGSAFKSLVLENNNLQDAFLFAFAKAMPNTGVVVFDVNLNQLTDASVTALAKLLPQSGLQQLVLDNNPGITDAGGVALAQSLIEPTAEADTIGQNQVGRYEARAIRNAKLIVKLKDVSLEGANTGRPTVRAAEQVLSGRDFSFSTNSSSQFYSNPPAQLRLAGNSNANGSNMAAGAIGLGLIPGALLFLLAVYLVYRMSKFAYNTLYSEGTPSCKK